jgi:hypothetical protein
VLQLRLRWSLSRLRPICTNVPSQLNKNIFCTVSVYNLPYSVHFSLKQKNNLLICSISNNRRVCSFLKIVATVIHKVGLGEAASFSQRRTHSLRCQRKNNKILDARYEECMSVPDIVSRIVNTATVGERTSATTRAAQQNKLLTLLQQNGYE